MFKCGLLATTAFVVVGPLSFAAAQPQALAREQMTNIAAALNRDANTEFLCTYGQLSVSSYISRNSGFSSSNWTHIALPIFGHGQTVSQIIVKEARGPSANYSSSQFSVGIYGNAPGGRPGKLIAGGTGRESSKCQSVTIQIPPTNLKRGRHYWIEEMVPQPNYSTNSAVWAIAPIFGHLQRKAYRQTHHWSAISSEVLQSSTSDWKKLKYGVYARVM